MTAEFPTPQALTRDQCLALLRTAPVGRVAYTHNALPAVLPVLYALDGNSVVFCTTPHSQLARCAARTVVAFEVDEYDVDTQTRWSVTVTGTAEVVTDPREMARLDTLPLRCWESDSPDRYVRIATTMITGHRRAVSVSPPAVHRR